MTRLQELYQEHENLFLTMPHTHEEQRCKNQRLFLIAREIERLENPEGYARNQAHWEGHETRM